MGDNISLILRVIILIDIVNMYYIYFYRVIFILLLTIIILPGCSGENDVNGNDQPQLETGAVLDADENVYTTVKIGDQWWMAENLRVTVYLDGSVIPDVQDDTEWLMAEGGAMAYYDNNENLGKEFGALYNWYAVVDERGLCPDGWKVPSDDDWQILEKYLGMSEEAVLLEGLRGTDQGGMLKDTGTQLWNIPNAGATNETGFTALPAGSRQVEPIVFFDFLGEDTYYWTVTGYDENNAWNRGLTFKTEGIFRYSVNKRIGYSVRCLME